MTSVLTELIKRAIEGDDLALMEIILQFKPLLAKFSEQLNYYCSETDLTIFLIELIKGLNLSDFNDINDAIIVNLIYKSLCNKKVDLYRKNKLKSIEECVLIQEITPEKAYMEPETEILIRNALDTLPKQQKIILVKKYYKGYSDTEIAHCLNISRQAVNRAKNKALEKLRKLLDN